MMVSKFGHRFEEIPPPAVQGVAIDILPKELIELILHVLDAPKAIFSLGATCKKYYIICHGDTFCRSFFHKHFSHAGEGDIHLYKELAIRRKNIKNKNCKINILGCHKDAIKTLLVNENYLYTGSFNGVVMCWDLNERKCIHERNYGQRLCCFEIDGDFIYTGSRDGVIRIWDMTKEEAPIVFEGGQASIYHLQVEEAYLLSSSSDGTIRVWNKYTGAPQCTIAGLNQSTFTPFKAVGDSIYIGLDNGVIRVQHVTTGDLLQSFNASGQWRINCLEVSRGYLYVGLQDNRVVIIDIATQTQLGSVHVDEGTPFSLQVEGNCLYVGLFNGEVKVLDLTTKEWLQTFKEFARPAIRFRAVRNQFYMHSQDHMIRALDFAGA